jgi:hypothetical protein
MGQSLPYRPSQAIGWVDSVRSLLAMAVERLELAEIGHEARHVEPG